MSTKIQDIFRLERTKKRLTMRDVAKLAGVSVQTVGNAENLKKPALSLKKKRTSEIEVYKSLCAVYGLDADKIKKIIEKQRKAEKIAEYSAGDGK